MGKKYIIEIPEENIGDFIGSTHFLMPYMLAGHMGSHDTGLPIEPYTEPDLEQVRKEAYDDGYNAGFGWKIDTSYQEGLADAWEAARKIHRMPDGDILDLFPDCYASVCTAAQAILKYDASEAIAKIQQYEQEQEEQDGLRQNIQTIIDQCGYTLDEIAAVLQKMRGEQE